MYQAKRNYLAEIVADATAGDLPNLATLARHEAEVNNLRAVNADLLAALEGLLREIPAHIGKRNVKKHYSLMVYEEAARAAIAKAKGK